MNRQARLQVDPPTSYDLMRSLVQELGGTVNRVVVSNVANETFYAKVIMSTDNRQIEVDSRPSDAIALALRAHVPIFAEASVLDRGRRRELGYTRSTAVCTVGALRRRWSRLLRAMGCDHEGLYPALADPLTPRRDHRKHATDCDASLPRRRLQAPLAQD